MRVALNLSSPRACQPLSFGAKSKNVSMPVAMKASDAFISSKSKQQNLNEVCFLLACERVYNKKVKSLNDRKI